MKNLLIFTGPDKKFNSEHDRLAKIQIDNSLDLGWKKEDILLFTDFEWEYRGVKSILLTEDVYYPFDLAAGKIPVIVYLLNKGLLEQDQLYWSHDFDAFENTKILESELGLEEYDLGLTHYTYKPEWQCGSIFFKNSAKDILELIDKTTREKPHLSRNNEKTLTWLIKHNQINPKRYQRMNVSYNIMSKFLQTIYPLADKPLKVLHFLPSKVNDSGETALEMFMYGKNRLNIPLMSDRLIKLFKKHGFV
jgi:hypothetical protein